MRTLMLSVLAGWILCSGLGCVVALGNKGSVKSQSPTRTPVVVDGEVYIVNLRNGTVEGRIEESAFQDAGCYHGHEAGEVKVSIETD